MMRKAAQIGLYAGIVGVVLGLSKAHAVMHGYDYSESARFGYSLLLMAFHAVCSYGLGLPDLVADKRAALGAAVKAVALATVALSVIELPLASGALPRFVIFGAAALLLPWYWLCALLSISAEASGVAKDRIFVVGGKANAEALSQEIGLRPERPAVITGSMSAAQARGRGRSTPLITAVESAAAQIVVIDREALLDERILDQAAHLHGRGVRIRNLSAFYDQWLGKISLAELERASLMLDISQLHKARYGRLKRVMDGAIGLMGTAVLVGLVPVVVVGNLIANRGSLFYRQPRIGRDGRSFEILKFRTMRHDPSPSNEWTSEDDPRITRFGRLLRRTHMDELPQVINILLGDLSIVGPRPEQPQYVARLTDEILYYPLRHAVSPGLTGWAQIKYGYAGNETDARYKLQYDFYYLFHQSLWLDLQVIGRTVRSILGLAGR